MQNIMVRGGKNKNQEKKEENYTKKGGKGLKNASFWAINSKKNSMHNI